VSADLLFGEPGKREERIEWGQRSIRDNFLIGPKGTVRPCPGEQAARGYDGAFYEGGPIQFEPVRRTVVTYTTAWERA
jgi:hypothetical protein